MPSLSEGEQRSALDYFRVIDRAFPDKGSFMSYMYVLEFVMVNIGRADMLPYISRPVPEAARKVRNPARRDNQRCEIRRKPASLRLSAMRLLFHTVFCRFR